MVLFAPEVKNSKCNIIDGIVVGLDNMYRVKTEFDLSEKMYWLFKWDYQLHIRNVEQHK